MNLLGATIHRNDLMSFQNPRDRVDHGAAAYFPFFRENLRAPVERGAES